MDPFDRLRAHAVLQRLRRYLLYAHRPPRPARGRRPRVAAGHHAARRAEALRRRAHHAGAGVRDVLALRRRTVARPLRGGVPAMTAIAVALAFGVVALLPRTV